MTTKGNLLALATALCALLFAPAARSDDSDATMIRELEQRLLAAEDKLQDSETTIQAQRELLKEHAAPAVGQGSGLDAFFSKLEVGGHVTGSYAYSFNNPSQSTGTPIASQPLNQFNLNHNTFTVDAAKLELGRPTDGPGTAGFQLELLFGANNNVLSGAGFLPADSGVFVQEAYAAYDFRGVEFKLGQFETLLGFEVLDSPANPNVTHGLLYTFAIPIHHTGLLASGDFSEELGWAAGVTNGFNNAIDTNNDKGLLGQLRFGSGPAKASLNAYYGGDVADNNNVFGANLNVDHTDTDRALILDFVGTVQATDQLMFWLNADYGEQSEVCNASVAFPCQTFQDMNWYGAAIGGKAMLSEKFSFAVRGEYLHDENGFRLNSPLNSVPLQFWPPGLVGAPNADAYSLTGTLGYALTQNLLARVELRYDRLDISGSGDQIFPDGSQPGTALIDFENDALTGLLEVSYSFD